MESSSDESFAWTNASSNSDDSDSVKSTSIMFDNKEIYSKEVDVTSNKVSEKSFPEKKGKKKKLVTEPHDSEIYKNEKKKIKEELPEDYLVGKKKLKKNKNESNGTLENSQQYNSHDEEYLKIKVKQEQDDFDAPTNTKTKKSKRRHTENNSGHESFIELDTTKIQSSSEKDEKKTKKKKYKDLESDSIMSEQKPVKSPKKSRNKSKEDINTGKSNDSNFIIEDDTFSVTELVVHKKRKHFKHNTNDESYNETITDSTESINNEQRTNKKKKKIANNKSIKKDVSSDDNQIIEDKFSAEETVVQRKSKQPYTNSEINSKEDANSPFKDKVSMGKNKLLNVDNSSNRGNIGTSNYSDTNNDNSDSEKIMSESIAEVSPHSKSMSSRNTKKSPIQGTPKIMDRLTFEEEIDSEADSSQNNTNNYSLQFNKFLKKNTRLQPVLENLENFTDLTQNDEIWLIKCPQEVDITNFYNKDLIVDHKSKIKINGETYNGTLDEEIDKVTVLSTDKSEYMIKDVKVNGIITFRKRLPKPHVQEDNVMSNNQTDFIPLPETKCRHPLFGSNYKNSIKIPTSVAHRLNSFSTDTSTAPNERKKKKKYKKEPIMDKEMDVTLTVNEPKVEVADDVPRKKAKKRKQNNDDDICVKKAKRIKQELDSSEVWESEKAIEENLFSF